MLKWLFGSKKKDQTLIENRKAPGAVSTQVHGSCMDDRSSRIEDLKSALPPEAKDKVLPIRDRLSSLVVTPPEAAREQLDATNVSRQRVWGDQAVRVPIIEGTADDIFRALLKCVVADYRDKGVESLSVEEVAAPANDDEARHIERARQEMRADLDSGMRDYYEKKMMKHMRKKGKGKREKSAALREINLKLSFGQTFGPHRIIRISGDSYYFTPCSVRE